MAGTKYIDPIAVERDNYDKRSRAERQETIGRIVSHVVTNKYRNNYDHIFRTGETR